MKKKILLAVTLLVTLSVVSYAQGPVQGTGPTQGDTGRAVRGIRNKWGHPILPRQGDIALGFNALGVIGLLNNVGLFNHNASSTNLGNNSGEPSQYTSNTNNQITGKYFLTDEMAVRVQFGYNSLSGNITNPVQNAVAMYQALQSGTPNDIQAAQQQTVNDKITFNKANILLSVGVEKRRGYGRLQGFYGASVGVGMMKNNTNVYYGNAFSNQYESVYTTNFNTGQTATLNPATTTPVTRNQDTTYTAQWTIGIRGFVGVEYFVFPKISVGAEFGWGYAISTRQGEQVTNETYVNGQAGPSDVVQTTNVGTGATTRGFSVDNNSGRPPFSISTAIGSAALNGATGAITILFHF